MSDAVAVEPVVIAGGSPAEDAPVRIRFDMDKFHWADFKRFRAMQKNPVMDEAKLDWFTDFIDRVTWESVDNVPLMQLMTLIMDAMNAAMAERVRGSNAKN